MGVMPLDWNEVKRRYGSGFLVPTVAGGKTLEVTAADEERIYIKTPLWKDELQRTHLEKAVSLIEDGHLTRHPGHFAEEYRHTVADVRGSSVAHILKDLGFLD
jgi:hypothetical protein